VGLPTLKAVEGNKIIPGLLDRYLARKGYSGQQTGEPRDPNQPDNLWEPLDGESGRDHGAHGRFDSRSRRASPELWMAQNRGLLGLLAATVSGLGLGFALGSRNGKH